MSASRAVVASAATVVSAALLLGVFGPAAAQAEVIDVSTSGKAAATATVGRNYVAPVPQSEVPPLFANMKDYGKLEDNTAAVGIEAVNVLAQMVASPGLQFRPDTIGGLVRLGVAGAQIAATGGASGLTPGQIQAVQESAGAIPMLLADLINQGKVLPQQLNAAIHLPGTIKDRLGINTTDWMDDAAIAADDSGLTQSLQRLQRIFDQTDTGRLASALDNLGGVLNLDNLMRLGLGTMIPGLDMLTGGANAFQKANLPPEQTAELMSDLSQAVNG
ncbi:hypothetical protein [Prescottella agglutinans]|uniref:Uncharacterized protein n=1 Tax=Prescottella agglutinans TaxID=1644129 RepID=A0ABT6MJ35_9NOCA|nr:hypothetical protein [Prescottella agglutinans]MDH6284338.1 hypothetical protein [Prescottella agglutinans]